MKTIFLTNDDGIGAKGLHTLARLMSRLGRVIVVAPDGPRSGAACSITSGRPIELAAYECGLPDMADCPAGDFPIECWICSGTPVDCVKLASEQVLTEAPDLMVSGINHGDNASCSVHYSGTVGAVVEATLKGWPAVAYSLCSFNKHADIRPFHDSIVKIAASVLEHGLPKGQCLNVNYPDVPQLKGERVVRLARGQWTSEWSDAANPHGKHTYWLTGHFSSLDDETEETDCSVLGQGYASVTPLQMDMTAYETLEMLRKILN